MSWRTCASSLVVLALVAASAGCGSAGRPATATATATASAPAARPAPAQLARFALLRSRAEGLPAATLRDVRPPTTGISWRLAKRIPVALPGAYWLVPGARYLCIVSQIPSTPGVGALCLPTAQALRHGIASVSIPSLGTAADRASRLIVGVAPDGTREVVVHTGRAVATAAVVGGVFVRRDAVGMPPDDLTLR